MQPSKSSEGINGGINGVQEKVAQGEQEQDQHGQRQDQQPGSNGQWPLVNGIGQGMNSNSFGFDGTAGFANMGYNGVPDFSQMLQFMPNEMSNNAMSAFPNMMGKYRQGLLRSFRTLTIHT